MRAHSLALVLVAAVGCSSSSPTRTVTGQLRSSTSNPVVATSMDHQLFTASVGASGSFALQLPTGNSYELTIGAARVDWPTATGPARWAKLGDGATLDLGHVSRQSDGHYACDHHGSEGDHCDRDDDHDGGDDDHGEDGGDREGDHDDGGDHGGSHACDGGTHSGGGGSGGGGGGSGTTGSGGIH